MGKLTTEQNIKIENEVMHETRAAMEKSGMGLDRGLLKLEQLMEATKPISCIKGKEADGGTVDFVDVPDNQTQIKALDMYFTLRGDKPPKEIKAEVNHSGSIMAAVASHLSNPKKAEVSPVEKKLSKAKPKTKLKAKKK